MALVTTATSPAQTADDALDYDLERFRKVSPELMTHSELDPIPLPFTRVHALCVATNNRIAVAGDDKILMRGPGGQHTFTLPRPASSMTFGPDDRLYVALKHHIAVYDAAGHHLDDWATLGEAANLASILSLSNTVVVADAGQHTLFLFTHEGKLIRHIGPNPPSGRFVNPSPNFDLVAGKDNTFWVANTGRLRIEQFALDGTPVRQWGRASLKVKGFCGCCNPIHMARAADGTLFTAEKGLARIKHYSEKGRLQGVVAAPDQFESTVPAADLAVDSGGRVLVLDPKTRAIRIFVRKAGGPE